MSGVTQIHAKILLIQKGKPAAELMVIPGCPPRLDFTSDAQVKTRLCCRVAFAGSFCHSTDRLKLYLVENGLEKPLGEFIVVKSRCIFTGATPEYELTCFDLTSLCRRQVAKRPFFAAGSLYTDAIRQLLTGAGIVHMQVEKSDLCFATDREDWEPGTMRIAIINQLLKEMCYHSLYCDAEGTIQARRYTPPAFETVSIRYKEKVSPLLLPGHEIISDTFERPNIFYYLCDNPDLPAPLSAVAVNDNPASPFSVQQQGEVPCFVRVDNAPGPEALQRMAEVHRLKSMMTTDEIQFFTGLTAAHGAFEVIGLQTEGFDGIIEETHWCMDIASGGIMRHKGRWVRYLPVLL